MLPATEPAAAYLASHSRSVNMVTGALRTLLAGLVALLSLTCGVQGHGWLSFPESRNSRLNQVAPGGLAYNRMNGNGRATWLPLNPPAQPSKRLHGSSPFQMFVKKPGHFRRRPMYDLVPSKLVHLDESSMWFPQTLIYYRLSNVLCLSNRGLWRPLPELSRQSLRKLLCGSGYHPHRLPSRSACALHLANDHQPWRLRGFQDLPSHHEPGSGLL